MAGKETVGLHICEFTIKLGEDDKKALCGAGLYRCTREATRLIRSRWICDSHRELLQTDNKMRMKKGIDIPNNTEVIIKIDPSRKLDLKKIK
jgi:hypothetical protein